MKSLTNYINESNKTSDPTDFKEEYVDGFIKEWKTVFRIFTEITETAKNLSATILSPLNFFEYDGNNIDEIAADVYDNIIEYRTENEYTRSTSVWVSVSLNDKTDKEMEQNFYKYFNEMFDLDPKKTYDGQIIRDESGYMFMLHHTNDLHSLARIIASIDSKL